ncbi:MAG: hypothetical protein ACTSWX_00705 [Promethearchaeota archaeon]
MPDVHGIVNKTHKTRINREILVPYAPCPRRVIPNLPAGNTITIKIITLIKKKRN